MKMKFIVKPAVILMSFVCSSVSFASGGTAIMSGSAASEGTTIMTSDVLSNGAGIFSKPRAESGESANGSGHVDTRVNLANGSSSIFGGIGSTFAGNGSISDSAQTNSKHITSGGGHVDGNGHVDGGIHVK